MQVPPEIVLKGIEVTPYINSLINKGIEKLEQVCDYIISTHIAVEPVQRRHLTGNAYRMRIDIRIPNRADIVVKRSSKSLKNIEDRLEKIQIQQTATEDPDIERSLPVGRSPARGQGMRDEPLQALIRRTFESARRELEKVVDKQRGQVKTPAQQQMQAVIEKIFREQEYGFMRSLEGQQIYFHRNSVLHNHWEHLTVGTIVRYTPQLGEKGLQASTVEVVNKPGAAEMHEQLHELPDVAPPLLGRKRQTARAKS